MCPALIRRHHGRLHDALLTCPRLRPARAARSAVADAVVPGQKPSALAGAAGVSGEGQNFGVVHQRSTIAAATTSSENVPLQRPKGRLLATMIEPSSYLDATSCKNKFAASWSNGM